LGTERRNSSKEGEGGMPERRCARKEERRNAKEKGEEECQ
jgi:hypothetical protein